MKHFFLRSPRSKIVRLRMPRFVVSSFLVLAMLIGMGSFLITGKPTQSTHAAPGKMPIGLNVDFNEQSLVDMVQNVPRFQDATGADANGWPTSDFRWIIDNRYTFAWVPGATNIDPLKYSTDISGTYKLSFNGQADLADESDDPAHAGTTITNKVYNASTNTTTADINIPNPSGGVLAILKFSNTRRDQNAAVGSGITNIRAIRPGYHDRPNQIFTDQWLHSIKDFDWDTLRFMGALGTNDYAQPSMSERYPYRLNWATDRRISGYGPLYSMNHVGVRGVPWEYVVLIAQMTQKNLWITLPVNASDEYVQQVANLLRNGNAATGNQGVPNNVAIYIEYSNEMWHYGFPQGAWNYQAGKDEVAAGGSNLNYDNVNNDDTWRFRRMAKRTIEIGNQFKSVFNDNGTRIRPVIDNAFVDRNWDMLQYVTDNYGAPRNVLYGISQTGYYISGDSSSVDAIINGEKVASDNNKAGYIRSRAIASYFGLHSLVYEGGEHEHQDENLANKFAAARDPRMQDVVMHDFNNWFSAGGELYMYFAHVGRYSSYGFWGLSEDINNLDTGKWRGVKQAMNTTLPATNSGVTVNGSGSTSFAASPDIMGTNFGRPNSGQSAYYLLHASQGGTYDITISTNEFGGAEPGQAQLYLNNQKVGGVVNMTASANISFGSVTLQPGFNTLRLHAVKGSFDPAYPNDAFHYQWQPTNITLQSTGTSSEWTKCADEGGICTFSGTQVVRYGANGQYAYRTATNSIECNNGTFGDPISGTSKACHTVPVPPSGWTICADENGTCNVSGTKTVAYGANGQFSYRTVTNSVGCNNGTFGDPINGTFKSCYYK